MIKTESITQYGCWKVWTPCNSWTFVLGWTIEDRDYPDLISAMRTRLVHSEKCNFTHSNMSATYCPDCGDELITRENTKQTCDDCRAEVRQDDKYCWYCGKDLWKV